MLGEPATPNRNAETRPTSSLYNLLGLSCALKIVDVGANPDDGSAPPPYSPLMAAANARVIGFEPNLEALAALDQRKGPNEVYLPYAIGDGHRHLLYHCYAPGMTSLLQPNAEVLSLFHGFSEWGRVVRTEEIETVRLDDVHETEGLDFLKVDIQGAELLVFENAVERLATALVIQTEVEFLPMYVGQPLFSDVERFLRQHGFMLHRFQPLVSRAVKPLFVKNNIFAGFGQLVWTDAIFVRELTRLTVLNTDQLLRLAVILADCYRSYDVALHVLLEHDNRTGGQSGQTFLKTLTAPTQSQIEQLQWR
jgi:FkbM family methyltransferase